MGVRLAAFNLPSIAKLTMTDELHLQELGERKIALFCCIPDSDKSLNYLVGMIYTQLIQTLYRQADRINDFGWPISPDHYGKIVDRVAEKAGIRKIHPHMFRHTFVSILLSNPDIGVATVAAEAGHAQPSTTLAIYTQVYHKRQDSIRSQMSETLYKRKTPER